MLLIAEVAITIWGIVILCRGHYKVGKTHEVTGGQARLIGALMTATLPLVLVLGFAAGFAYGVIYGRPPQNLLPFALIDLGVVIGVVVVATILANAYKRPIGAGQPGMGPGQPGMGPGQPGMMNQGMPFPPNQPPADPNNPYSSPHSTDNQ